MDSIRTSQITTTTQHISESVFVGLCRRVGTSQQVAMRRDVVGIRDKVISQTPKRVDISWIFSGSHKEGFRLQTSDVDMMVWQNEVRVIWELSQSQNYNINRQTLILCDCSDSPPGYTLLYFLSPSMDTLMQRKCVHRMNNRYYISSSKYKQFICSTVGHCTQHGPCASGIHITLEYDVAVCFICDFWPPCVSLWIDRCHSWPQPHIVNDIVNTGCHLVAIGHTLSNHEDHEWRISFSLAELKLVQAMNHCQFLTYGLLKLFLSEVINKGLGDDDKLLCSYHMKTAVFWVIQQNTIPHWCPQNLLECFWVCFKLILKWVYEGACPNFFIPSNNMFLSKVHGAAQNLLFNRLYGLYEKGLESLLHSLSIRSYVEKVLHNPRLSIFTDQHTLISEAEFDVELFAEINKFEALFPLHQLQDYTSCLHTIEKMIGSSITSQNQVIMLQKITVSVLQHTAFILHMKNYACKNKLRYRAEKISCHMLKLAAKLGCVSDMLHIAMYCYKTCRYMDALSIIEVTKVKLAQPYVTYWFNKDAEKYTETVGGQSWSTKMRQAIAMDIKFNQTIHYISELIPEQQTALLNGRYFSIIPPFILLRMLEILCYRHVDTMRAQTALDDLQTLVHYDQGQRIPLHFRDISWQILGICQQVTGNLQDALYSYYQSLRQVPFHRIQKATIIRVIIVIFRLLMTF